MEFEKGYGQEYEMGCVPGIVVGNEEIPDQGIVDKDFHKDLRQGRIKVLMVLEELKLRQVFRLVLLLL